MRISPSARLVGFIGAWCVLVLGTLRGAEPETTSSATFETTVQPLLRTYCSGCHGPNQQKGDRRFDRLDGEVRDMNALADYQDILDQLNLGDMPPQDARQPSAKKRQRAIAWLTQRIKRFHEQRQTSSGETVLRRLNSREYRNTVRDLLHLDMTMFDPTSTFPRDQMTEHLDNVGDALVTSGHLLARYLVAAEQVIDKAMTPLEKPAAQTWTFRDGFHQQPEIDKVHRETNHHEHMTLYDVVGADKHEGAYGPIHAFAEGVPIDGLYEIRLKAEAVNRRHPYDPEFLGTDPDEPLRLGIVAGDHLAGALHKPQPVEPLLAEIDLADESKWYTVRVRLDAGYTPRFTFRNGLMDARNLWSQLLKKYADQFPERTRPGIVEARFNAIKYGKLPQIHIHEIEIEGPIYETWPTDSQHAIFGDDCRQILEAGAITDEQMRRNLMTFVSRAYRRPAEEEDVDRVLEIVAARQQAGRSSLEAYGDGLKAVLCSPHFLYLAKSDQDRLPAHALASRLSYFLWSSMPDQQLLDLAADDRLRQPDVLAQQIERMLDDPKSDAFIAGFLQSWLTLRDLGSMPPDRSQFRAYYHYGLDQAMRQETKLFTRHLLDENLSIANFLDADFTFVNKRLAEHYGIPAPAGSSFEMVRLNDRRRGGLLGQASVLTVTANGIETSPVGRGVWMLENILGTPPSPPPDDVEPLDPDIRGAKTIRDQLSKHRDVPSCNECHRKIDPMGFALENFDPIGGWRDTYGRKSKVDASGELPNGKSFENIEGLKTILVEQQDQFARALTEKLLAYSMGRTTGPTDRPHTDQIITDLNQRGGGFRDLVSLVAMSEPFLSK